MKPKRLRTKKGGFNAVSVALLVAGLFQATALGQNCTLPPTGLAAWWRAEDNALDAAGTNSGVLQNGAGFAPGMVGTAFSLDGINDFIEVANSPQLNPTNSMSVEAWYKPTVSFVGNGGNALVDKGFNSQQSPYYQYHLSVTGDQWPSPVNATFAFAVAAGGSYTVVQTPPNSWVTGQWYHVVGSYDGTAVRIFVNGALSASTPASGTVSGYGRPLRIGAFWDLSDPGAYTPGLIDEVSIYNRGLTSNEVSALYAAGAAGKCAGSGTQCISNICFTRTNVTQNAGSTTATIILHLPLGLSVCTNFSATNRLTSADLVFTNVTLDANLHPASQALTYPGALSVVEETKPFWLHTSSLQWLVNAGQLLFNANAVQFVRQEEDDVLSTPRSGLVDITMTNRISNDGYYRNASVSASSAVVVKADTNGVARMTGQIALNPPELRPHFPFAGSAGGSQIHTGAGQLAIQDGLIDSNPLNSRLAVAGSVPLSYARDCSDTNCSQATTNAALLQFNPINSRLEFTADGGLLADGLIPPANLTWAYAGGGNFAQRTSDVSNGVYHVPGTFLRSDQTTAQGADLAGVLLFTGFGDATNHAYVERYDQTNYLNGLANYAGLNFRAPAQGRSYVARTDSGLYPLTARSKYYVRYGGVSGIHESASFPANMILYGYPFTFISYRLSYLDSENWESRTDGAVRLPYPAQITNEFSRMKFVCLGDLESAQVAPNSGPKHLVYWNTDILPQSIQFKGLSNDVCGDSGRTLVLGVQTKLPLIPQALHAQLGFRPTGYLTSAADAGQLGVDSRFALPAHLWVQGPNQSRFAFSTSGEGYFNNPQTSAQGFFNMAGRMHTFFFGDVKVHLHLTPETATTGRLDIMGGWPLADGEAENLGWNVGNNNFFNFAKFDPSHNGFPQSVSLLNYRQSTVEAYHPRAQRNWNDVVKFDYLLEWDRFLREFRGFKDATVKLPIINVTSRLKELTPGKADFDFAQDISVQLPRVKVLDFANDAVNEIDTTINSVSAAIQSSLPGRDTSGLTSGFRGLQGLLREEVSGVFKPVLQQVFAPAASNLCNALSEMQRTNPAALLTSIGPLIGDSANGLDAAVGRLNGAANDLSSIFGQVEQALMNADSTMNLFRDVLQRSGGTRPVVQAIVQAIGGVSGGAALNDVDPTLARLALEVGDLQTQFTDLRRQIESGAGNFRSALGATLNDGNARSSFRQAATKAISDLLAVRVTPLANFFTDDPVAARQAILDRLIMGFLSSPLVANYQRTFKQFLTEDSFLLNQLVDVFFDQVNRVIRETLPDATRNATDNIPKNFNGVGQMSQSLLAARIRGAPTFEGGSLRNIHLDAAVTMNLPDEMKFNAYMDIKEIRSQTVPCGGQDVWPTEVTIGAVEVPLGWTGISAITPPTLTIEGRWDLQCGKVLGVGGLFDIKGEVGFKGCSVKEIGATFAVGEFENYFACKAKGSILVLVVPVDVDIGLFAGQAKSLDPLKFIDPEVGDVLNHPDRFTGVYVQYGGGFSLSEILFGTSSCALDVQAHATGAVFYEGAPRWGRIGFRQKDSLDIRLLCGIEGHLDLSLGASAKILSLTPPPPNVEINVVGSGNVCGKIGYCPFCLKGCKRVTLSGVVNDRGIHFHLDY